ncbi:DUF4349 domain-containing protein [Peribacillus glennii]|uniref:DUF4349 domain-containing protein n=1 Tax=Peribacillus glennii TaxID=2303991 RepID=A0A372LCJ8_9BACI|nr:DUF4349 domain-containing protein [Peribacillus glennii]RFU63719.1 DUF4349 domain-containing protein [Peribacillus glennii]
MKWKKATAIYIFLLLFMLAGCSENNESSTSDKAASGGKQAADMNQTSESKSANEKGGNSGESEQTEPKADRMIIHNADLQLEVKNLEKTHLKLEEKVQSYGGYIVQSNVYSESEGFLSGTMVARIPEKSFQKFLGEAEGAAAKVIERSVKGEDVTEEYVDLESRLKSKRTVEARLLEFLKEAERTEDLLQISTDLGKVQEEIETIMGRMKFLNNQVSYSTVTINTFEEKVIVPNIDKEDLNTWEKTKKQFAGSINFLLATLSAICVFILGNLPVIIIMLGAIWIVYRAIKKRGNKKDSM